MLPRRWRRGDARRAPVAKADRLAPAWLGLALRFAPAEILDLVAGRAILQADIRGRPVEADFAGRLRPSEDDRRVFGTRRVDLHRAGRRHHRHDNGRILSRWAEDSGRRRAASLRSARADCRPAASVVGSEPARAARTRPATVAAAGSAPAATVGPRQASVSARSEYRRAVDAYRSCAGSSHYPKTSRAFHAAAIGLSTRRQTARLSYQKIFQRGDAGAVPIQPMFVARRSCCAAQIASRHRARSAPRPPHSRRCSL